METNINAIIDYIYTAEDKDFKCYDTLKKLLLKNENFREVIKKGINENKIWGFDKELWEKLSKQNLRSPKVKSFIDVFKDGYNQGYCTVCAKQVSYSLDTCYLCGGILPILKGTTNCPEGSHTWIEYKDAIIDTTLMLVIDKEYKQKLGYIEETRYNPNIDPIYNATKEFTNDESLKRR